MSEAVQLPCTDSIHGRKEREGQEKAWVTLDFETSKRRRSADGCSDTTTKDSPGSCASVGGRLGPGILAHARPQIRSKLGGSQGTTTRKHARPRTGRPRDGDVSEVKS